MGIIQNAIGGHGGLFKIIGKILFGLFAAGSIVITWALLAETEPTPIPTAPSTDRPVAPPHTNPTPQPSSPTEHTTWDKPALYLYPRETQTVTVALELEGSLTTSYPAYGQGWQVLAYPDGKLINAADGKEYSYLFWEGASSKETDYDLSKGFVVAGKDTAVFLQDKLYALGLTPKEYNEFIVYWMPQMQDNRYNLIHFASKQEYDDKARLTIDPKPDSILRVFMVYKSLDKKVEVEPQVIKPFARTGFSVVEWGGTQVE